MQYRYLHQILEVVLLTDVGARHLPYRTNIDQPVAERHDAVKGVPEPHIALSASATVSKPRIQLSDNGKGIPSDLLENIFIPFFTTRKSGSGEGLTLSKQIMLLHGGNILVRSEEGKGNVFTLQF